MTRWSQERLDPPHSELPVGKRWVWRKDLAQKGFRQKQQKKVSLHLFFVGIETIKYIETALCRNKGLFNKFWKMKFCKETTYLDIRNEKEKRTVSARRIRTSEAGRQKAGWPSLLEWKGN